MYVKDKLVSDRIIVNSGVNYVPFINVFNMEDAREAILKIPEPIGFRAKKSFGGGLVGSMTRKEALQYIKVQATFEFPYSVYQDIKAIDEYLVFQGEIQLHVDGTMCGIYCSASGVKNRYAVLLPEAISFGMYYQSTAPHKEVNWGWRPMRRVVDYLCTYNLIGPVVEYSLFTKPLGIKNDPIVIWEVRSY